MEQLEADARKAGVSENVLEDIRRIGECDQQKQERQKILRLQIKLKSFGRG